VVEGFDAAEVERRPAAEGVLKGAQDGGLIPRAHQAEAPVSHAILSTSPDSDDNVTVVRQGGEAPAGGLRRSAQDAGLRLARGVYRWLPRDQRAYLNLHAYLWTYGDTPRIVGPPEAGRVAVLAPHPDDEALGCGGLICLLAERGAAVTPVILTDGALGGNGPALAGVRRGESERSAACLGARPPVFLDLPDGELQAGAREAGLLADCLRDLRPELLLLPFFTDQHPDHFQANALFLAATRRLPVGRPDIWAYETWTPLPANRLVDITAVAERKWEAIRCHESQAQRLDFLSAARGLNAFRWLPMGRGAGYAEAFFAASLSAYEDLFRRLAGRGG
jgi:LmbE family N-acetylglucosaminyl deacetylase